MPGPATLVGTHHAAPSHWPATPELTLVANAVDIAGHDECACCAGTRMVRNEESGMCDNVEEFEITFSSGPVGQRGKVRTYGADDYEREVAAANQRH